jgi:hypothetical protein
VHVSEPMRGREINPRLPLGVGVSVGGGR